jgi:glycosyltransferase involved in cell wall biosynthesis
LEGLEPDLIFVQFVRMAAYAQDLKAKKVLDYQDALSVGMERRAQKASGFMRYLYANEAKRLAKYESEVYTFFDAHTIITDADRKLLPVQAPHQIKLLPNGVDTLRFGPKDAPKIYDLVFTGNMNYPPNVDAVLFLVNEIMPLVWKIKPKLKVLIAGANPASTVKGCASDRVKVSGWMDDITDAYASSKVFIAPMRIGTGLQNKLLEAMSMQLPCITTPLANAALGAEHNTAIKVGQGADELAAHIIELMDKADLQRTIAKKGQSFVHQNYSWEAVGESLETIFNELIP